MDVTGERGSRNSELREILMSFQTGFNLVNAAVICAILGSISDLEPSSVITESRYLKLGFLGTDLHVGGCKGFVENVMLN